MLPKLLAQFKDYGEVLVEIVNDRLAGECRTLVTMVGELQKLYETDVEPKTQGTSTTASTTDPSVVFKRIHNLELISRGLRKIHRAYVSPQLQIDEMFDSNMSSAYRVTASDTLQRLQIAYAKYGESSIQIDTNIDHKLARTLYKKYPLSYRAYVEYLQQKLLIADEAVCDEIMRSIDEDAQVFVLPQESSMSTIHKNNPPLFTLQPASSVMPLQQLVANVFSTDLQIDMWRRDVEVAMERRGDHSHNHHSRGDHSYTRTRTHVPGTPFGSGTHGGEAVRREIIGSANTNIFKALSAQHKCCVVVAHHVTHHPVVHDIRKLVIYREAKDLIQSRDAGVTMRMVKRFQTIVQEEPAEWNFSYEIFNADASRVVIVETLDDENFRILTRSGYVGSAIMPSNEVATYVTYFRDAIKTSEMTGKHIHECSVSANNMFLEREIDIEELFKTAAEPSHSIVRVLTNAVHKHVDDLIGSKKLRSDADVIAILHANSIEEVVIETLLTHHDWYGDEQTFQPHELMSSFMADLLVIAKRFTRELHDGYTKKPLTDFSNVNTVIRDIITKAVELLLPDDTNIYQALKKKQLMLNAALSKLESPQ